MFLSPIHSLPVELLSRVFVLGADDDDPYNLSPFLLKPDQDYYAVPSTLFQLTASHVCRHWRHVALRTPTLWSTLCFREQSHIPRASTYLSRCSASSSRRLHILVDTVSPKDHIPGVTLCIDQLTTIFELIIPHVPFWHAFHLKIRDDSCKQIARKYLGNAPPAPNLQTLQLYHFEDFRVVQDLYIATYRRPVRIFSNSLPSLRNVSLIGVNLPWDQSPYLHSLHTLELALHSDHTRPPYLYWDRMLRLSPNLQRLLLTYSGPRAENGTEDLTWDIPIPPDDHDYYYDHYGTRNRKGKAKLIPQHQQHQHLGRRVLLESLWELSLTDLDPDYLCKVLQRLVMPSINKLSLDLPDQDFTTFVELIAPPSSSSSSSCPSTSSSSLSQDSTLSSSSAQTASAILDFDRAGDSTMSALSSNPLRPSSSSSSPSTTTTLLSSSSASSLLTLAPSSSTSSAVNPLDTTTNSISDKSIPYSGSPSTSMSTLSSPSRLNPESDHHHGINPYHDLLQHNSGPFPKISTTLHTLIITALECSWTAWKEMFVSLVNVQVLEVDFWKVCVTEEFNHSDNTSEGRREKRKAYDVLLEPLPLPGSQEDEATTLALPKLRKCKIGGVTGEIVEAIVQARERGGGFVGGGGDLFIGGHGFGFEYGHGVVEWSVVEEKGDSVLKRVFERGVWVSAQTNLESGYGGGQMEGVGEGRWIKIKKVVDDDEEGDDDDEDVGDEDDNEEEETEAVDADEDEVLEEEETETIDVDDSVSDKGNDSNQPEEQPDQYTPISTSTSSCHSPRLQFLPTPASSSKLMTGPTRTSAAGTALLDSTSNASTNVTRRSSRRVDVHRGLE